MKNMKVLFTILAVLFLAGDIMAVVYSYQYCRRESGNRTDEKQSTMKQMTDTSEKTVVLDKVYTVVIDPGHQDCSFPDEEEPIGPGSTEMKYKYSESDVGVSTGMTEAQLCLEVSLLLKKELENRGYTAVLTRTDNNTLMSSKERADVVTVNDGDIYIRIHGNYDSKSGKTSGAECIVPTPENTYIGYMYSDCLELGQLILNAYCVETGCVNRGCLQRDNLVGNNWSPVPVALIELGYLSNENEDIQMFKKEYQEKMAKGIAEGIEKYFAKEEES